MEKYNNDKTKSCSSFRTTQTWLENIVFKSMLEQHNKSRYLPHSTWVPIHHLADNQWAAQKVWHLTCTSPYHASDIRRTTLIGHRWQDLRACRIPRVTICIFSKKRWMLIHFSYLSYRHTLPRRAYTVFTVRSYAWTDFRKLSSSSSMVGAETKRLLKATHATTRLWTWAA